MCERYTNWLPLAHPQPGNLAGNPGMCSDGELNWRPCGSQSGTQSTEPHQPEQVFSFVKLSVFHQDPTRYAHLNKKSPCARLEIVIYFVYLGFCLDLHPKEVEHPDPHSLSHIWMGLLLSFLSLRLPLPLE